MKNPNWQRDELILALNLYFKLNNRGLDKNNPEIIQLSELLNKLPIHKGWEKTSSFRNSSGVAMKLSNFKRFDNRYLSKGLERGGRLEEVIWNEFNNHIDKLNQTAKQISLFAETEGIHKVLSEINPSFEVKEGKLITKFHVYRERNKGLVLKKKKLVLQTIGKLECEVCFFDFSAMYGKLGTDFIECHHTKPIKNLTPNERTKLTDLALVCSNCHRMIHKSGDMRIENLRKILKFNFKVNYES